jgi:hypothetical protein
VDFADINHFVNEWEKVDILAAKVRALAFLPRHFHHGLCICSHGVGMLPLSLIPASSAVGTETCSAVSSCALVSLADGPLCPVHKHPEEHAWGLWFQAARGLCTSQQGRDHQTPGGAEHSRVRGGSYGGQLTSWSMTHFCLRVVATPLARHVPGRFGAIPFQYACVGLPCVMFLLHDACVWLPVLSQVLKGQARVVQRPRPLRTRTGAKLGSGAGVDATGLSQRAGPDTRGDLARVAPMTPGSLVPATPTHLQGGRALGEWCSVSCRSRELQVLCMASSARNLEPGCAEIDLARVVASGVRVTLVASRPDSTSGSRNIQVAPAPPAVVKVTVVADPFVVCMTLGSSGAVCAVCACVFAWHLVRSRRWYQRQLVQVVNFDETLKCLAAGLFKHCVALDHPPPAGSLHAW